MGVKIAKGSKVGAVVTNYVPEYSIFASIPARVIKFKKVDIMNILMVGVGPKRVGGMWTIADQYIKNKEFNDKVNLTYIATSTNGSILIRFLYMLWGYIKILWVLHTKPIDIVHIHMAEKGSTFRKGRVAKWGRKKKKK